LAFAMSLLCRNLAVKPAVPVAFLLALVPAFLIAGRLASLLAAAIAIVIFAVYLFEPYGSLVIRSGVDRIELFFFALAALGLVRFCPGSALFHTKDGTARPSEQLEGWIAAAGYAVVFAALITLLLQMWNSMRY